MWQPVNAETEQPWWPTAKQWPIALHAREKTGGSFFTVAVAAECVRRHQPTVFLCAHAQAIQSLKTELHLDQPNVETTTVKTSAVATQLKDSLLVTMMHQPKYSLVEVLRALPDWNSRIIIIKNVESILTPELWSVVQDHRWLLLSGDFRKLQTKIDINRFVSRLAFSDPPSNWNFPPHHQPPYIATLHVHSTTTSLFLREKQD